ncbi:calcium homeostasis modulator protein 6 [Microcaecilia unicolor]|uniref:Calcium homeostasis modulator protein 6 n=1 Tax=Microcaecilia unicolor TaxID=1415580 RepID=A0A6P7XL58_9AMPH|nr:calcium homeostasis modulator protein 6 [Microcaecilia unicolor]
MAPFKPVLNLVVKHSALLGYGTLSLLAAGGEQLFSAVVFRCPCNSWNFSYSLVFLLVPALVLLLLGYVLSTRMWKLFTGCCASPRPRLYGGGQYCPCLCIFCQVTAAVALAPLTWIASALLNATFYECAMSGYPNITLGKSLCLGKDATCPQEVSRVPCANTQHLDMKKSQVEEILLQRRAESQVMGWLLIAGIMTLGLVFMCISHCCSPVSFLQLKFWKTYSQREQELFEQKSKEHARELAERNLKSFFESTKPAPFLTPSAKEWQQVSSLYTFNAKEQHYSMLHKYVERAEGTTSIRLSEGDGSPPIVLEFVDNCGEAGF